MICDRVLRLYLISHRSWCDEWTVGGIYCLQETQIFLMIMFFRIETSLLMRGSTSLFLIIGLEYCILKFV